MTIQRVTRQRDAQGAYCETCDVAFNITTCPYWHWSKSMHMHRDGTGHRVELYAIVAPVIEMPVALAVAA